jgi:hypothetical protein
MGMTTLATGTAIQKHEVVSAKEWIASRNELLRKEKESTKLRDDLSRQRRELPWESEPMRILKASISARGARETITSVTSRCAKCRSVPST